MKKTLISFFILVFLLGTAWFSWFLSNYIQGTDFPVYYTAAKALLDKQSIYNPEILKTYQTPDWNQGIFIYSSFVGYLMTPLGLLPYYISKSLIILLSILSYSSSVYLLIMRKRKISRWIIYSIFFAAFFLPFWDDFRFAEVNSLMLLCIVTSAYSIENNRPYLCGALIAFAALFKIFPIAIVMILGLKNWRIIVGFSVIFLLSFVIPDAINWIPAIINAHPHGYTLLYNMFGSELNIVYGCFVGGITALIVWKSEGVDYMFLIAFTIPAMFLSMPYIEYHHLTLVMLPIIYILCYKNNDVLFILSFILCFFLINIGFYFMVIYPIKIISYKLFTQVGLLVLWIAFAWRATHPLAGSIKQT